MIEDQPIRGGCETGLQRQYSANQSEKIHQFVFAHALMICNLVRYAQPRIGVQHVAHK